MINELAKPDRTILEALIDANGLKPVARALLAIAEERFPLIGPDPFTAPSLLARDPDWPYQPGYVGNDNGDICLVLADGRRRWATSGVVWAAADAVIQAEAYGWEVVPGTKGMGMVQIRR